ncbi:MAG: hypothetical protein U0T83_01315 [Bacteriovoracaceae bacterium]
MQKLNYWFVSCFLIIFSNNIFAKRFTSQYVEFELPTGWECMLEGAEWVCQSDNKDRKKEAIIILAAKVRGEQDSLEEYEKYLKERKTYTLPGGQTQVSESKYTKITDITSLKWVDSLHLASEVPGFYTRYLATVKSDLGIAVTFSVAKDLYETYQPVFDKVVATLRVIRQDKLDPNSFKLKGQKEDLFEDTTFVGDNAGGNVAVKKKSADGEGASQDMMLFGAVGALVLLLVFMRMKKGKKAKKKTSKKEGSKESVKEKKTEDSQE